MRKIWIISIIVASVLVLGIAIFTFIFSFGYHYQNNLLLAEYPALSYHGMRDIRFSNLSFSWKNNSKVTITEKTLFFDVQKREFSCNGKVRELITYESESMGAGVLGGWGSTYLIDCGDCYWVYSSGDANPFAVYGPFLFNESTDSLKQEAQNFYNSSR